MYNLLVCTSFYLVYYLFSAPSTVTICPFKVVVCKMESLSWSRQEKHHKTKISFPFSAFFRLAHFWHPFYIAFPQNIALAQLKNKWITEWVWGKKSKGLGKYDALKLELDLEKEKREWARALLDLTFTIQMFVKCILDNVLKLQRDECLI